MSGALWYLADELCCVCAGRTYPHGRGLTQTDGKGMPVTIVFGVVIRASILWLLYSASVECTEKRGHSFIYFYETWRHRSGCFAVVWFGERPGWNQGLGFILAITAILMIHLEKGKIRTEKAYTIGLLLLLLGGGAWRLHGEVL